MLKVNQTYKDLIELIKEALQSQQLNWQVIQNYQATMGNIKPPFVMLHRLTATNYGFQFGKDKDVSGTPTHTENQVEIQTYQIEANYIRKASDNVNTITGADVVRIIASWFMSDTGIQALRAKGYNVLRVTEVVEEYYKNISDIYQVNPHFRLELVALQSYSSPAHKFSGFTGKVKEVEQLKYERGKLENAYQTK